MKRIIYGFCLFCIPIYAQVENDPLIGIYKTGESSEVFMSFVNGAETWSKNNIIRIDTSINNYYSYTAGQNSYKKIMKCASASGDFNSDGRDDIVYARDTLNGIKITIPLVGKNLHTNGQKEFFYSFTKPGEYDRLRICSGNFDNDFQKEFIVCFGPDADDHLVILLFETDSLLNINLLASYNSIAYVDRLFDIDAGDLNGDFKDDLVLIRNSAQPYEVNSLIDPPLINTIYDIYTLGYNTETKSLNILRMEQNLKTENVAINNDRAYDLGEIFFNELRVKCGDMNADFRDEIYVGFSMILRNDISKIMYYMYDFSTFTHRIGLDDNGSIESIEPILVSDEVGSIVPKQYVFTWNEFPVVTLSLICDEFDKNKGDDLLINDSRQIHSFSEDTISNKLQSIGKLWQYAGEVQLNTWGNNECFVLSDIKPDSTVKNYTKQIIALGTDVLSIYFYPFRNNDSVSVYLSVFSLDSINHTTGLYLNNFYHKEESFALDSKNNIRFSSFLAGDYNNDCGEVFYVGAPQLLQAEMQQPIIILNSPPVHFDILNGTEHDLNNAYSNNGSPTFYAKYVNGSGNENTTEINVENSLGYSSDFEEHSFFAGSGFKNSTTNNFNIGKAFYNSTESNLNLEQEYTVYKEDFILTSRWNYKYYKYPVYDSSYKKTGYIGVIVPVSDVVYGWESGNSVKNCSYSFNHEPGNILSYKSIYNSDDLFHDIKGFPVSEFNQILVTNNSNGRFNLGFSNITHTGQTIQYESRVGQNRLIQSGYQATVGEEFGVTIEGVFNVGVSQYNEIDIGSSFDLSESFSNSSLYTHSNILKNNFNIEGYVGNLDLYYNNRARYYISPYIYCSQSGALVLDYKILLDEDNMDWWNEYYGKKPDLAFILPWRYGTEHGSSTLPSQKQKTNEIQFYPPIASPGDTVCIITRIHNYSLLPFIDTLKIDFYLGDPQDSGIQVKDIFDKKRINVPVNLDYYSEVDSTNFEEILTFYWQIPDTVTCSPRIYAKIDPENKINEIHEDNNVGWNKLYIYGCKECNYPEMETGIEEELAYAHPFDIAVFPNPISSSASITFATTSSERVIIEVLSLSGNTVSLVTDQLYPAGKHLLYLNSSNLNNGIYCLKMTIGNNVTATKICVVH
jgi:hypothetical protein